MVMNDWVRLTCMTWCFTSDALLCAPSPSHSCGQQSDPDAGFCSSRQITGSLTVHYGSHLRHEPLHNTMKFATFIWYPRPNHRNKRWLSRNSRCANDVISVRYGTGWWISCRVVQSQRVEDRSILTKQLRASQKVCRHLMLIRINCVLCKVRDPG